MKCKIYAYRQDTCGVNENTTIEADSPSLIPRIAETAVEWISEDSGGNGYVVVRCNDEDVTEVFYMFGEYLIDGDAYDNWRHAEEEVGYRVGTYLCDLEMENWN